MPAPGYKATYFIESLEEAEAAGKTRPKFLEQDVLTTETLDILKSTKSAVSIALGPELDLVSHVNELNLQGIPVDLWPVLTDKHGYWNTPGNIQHAERHVGDILEWVEQNKLKIRSVGLDLEADLNIAQAKGPLARLQKIREVHARTEPDAQKRLERLIDTIHSTKKDVDVYQMKFLGEIPVLRSLVGVYRPPENADQIVQMLYTSVNPLLSVARKPFKFSLSKDALPALGIISGTGVNPGRVIDKPIDEVPLLQKEQLVRDLGGVQSHKLDKFWMFALNGAEVPKRVDKAWADAWYKTVVTSLEREGES